MGLTQSCTQVPISIHIPVSPVSPNPKAYYTLPFICCTVPIDITHTSAERIFYAERWSSNSILWRTIIENAMNEILYKDLHPNINYPRMKINGLQIHTTIKHDTIVGSVQWGCREININLLNDIIEVKNNDEIYEKGIILTEPFWTTSIIPGKITKEIR